MIISVSGREGSGKDTVCNIIQTLTPNKNFLKKSFSEKLKDRVELTFPKFFSKEEWENSCEDRVYRDEIISELGISRRDLLREEGMKARMIHIDYWPLALFNNYNNENWLLKDTRFLNEEQFINRYKNIKVLLLRNYDNEISHESEKDIYDMDFHYKLDNRNTSYAELHVKVKEFCNIFRL